MSYLFKLCTVILISLPVYLLVRRPWKRKSPREWALGAFVLFMTGLLALTFEGVYGNPVWMLRNAARRLSSGDGVNLIPFRSIKSYFAHPRYTFLAINMIGNIVMFVPWGFGLINSAFYRKECGCGRYHFEFCRRLSGGRNIQGIKISGSAAGKAGADIRR